MHTRAFRTMVVAAAVFGAVVSARVVTEGAQAPATGNANRGEAVFAKVGCATCHGPQGGGTAAAPSLVSSAMPIKDFIAYVRQPRGTMPPHPPQAVSDASLTDIYAYVHQKTAAPAAAAQASQGAPAGDVAAGGKLFATIGCYQCHANEAQGATQGPRLGPNPVPWARFSSYVRHPTNDMPPYTTAGLSDQGLADIYAWVQARPAPPALSSVPLLAP
jgi:mono/diheme cytochrome c family protein